MREQAVSYGADYRQAQVYGIDATGDLKVVYTPEGTFRGKTLVLATGAMGALQRCREKTPSWVVASAIAPPAMALSTKIRRSLLTAPTRKRLTKPWF